jgi:polyphosphate kinase
VKKLKSRYYDRDLSWLSFNYRVLQEAMSNDVPLIERLKFLAIFSSNMDEFFRVRVALHSNAIDLKIKSKEDLVFGRKKLLSRIKKVVYRQQDKFGKTYNNVLLPLLRKNNIEIVNEKHLNGEQQEFIRKYFKTSIAPELQIIYLNDKKAKPFLENKQLYFAIELLSKNKKENPIQVILNIPSEKLPRFIKLPSEKKHVVTFLDDIIRFNLPDLFNGYKIMSCHAIKLTRDAELFLEESDNILEEIKKKLIKRKTNPPSRLLYDASMPKHVLKVLIRNFGPKKQYTISGGRYHNFDDFFKFPSPPGTTLKYIPQEELKHPILKNETSIYSAVSKKDQLLHFPYQKYDYVIRFLEEAAADPEVKSIKITLYRLSDNSKIANALLTAAKNGKKVIAFVEVKARFNEASNIFYQQQFKEAGIMVLDGFSKMKVHCKLCVIERNENGTKKRYAYLSTGNFNETTSRFYGDYGFLTARKDITKEANSIFDFLANPKKKLKFEKMMVAPFNLRTGLEGLIDTEIKNAKEGKKASIILKVNSLEDPEMINHLYRASNAGVKIRIIVRGMCCLIPGEKGMSKNIKVVSIIDRYLEHGRVYIFYNAGKEKIFISSADLMTRSLTRRVEAAFPVMDTDLRIEIKNVINIQLNDNMKSRKINKIQSNPFNKSNGSKKVRAQEDTYYYLKDQLL